MHFSIIIIKINLYYNIFKIGTMMPRRWSSIYTALSAGQRYNFGVFEKGSLPPFLMKRTLCGSGEIDREGRPVSKYI